MSGVDQGIPLTVVGGFLGSGKTTLINHILSARSGLRTAVLVNDFGSVNIDANLIEAAGGETIALTNGCVCCSIGDDLTDTLIRVMGRQPVPDWIVIEASGVSDPGRIADIGKADPALRPGGTVVLVDAGRIKKLAAEPRLADTIGRQLVAADTLILNKTDLLSTDVCHEVHSWLSGQVPQAPIHEARNADVSLDVLTGLAKGTQSQRSYGPASSSRWRPPSVGVDHAHAFSTWTFETVGILNFAKLKRVLDTLPEDIMRAKGLVRVDVAPDQLTSVQFAGTPQSLEPFGPWRGEPSRIVFIRAGAHASFSDIEAPILDSVLTSGAKKPD